MKKSLNLIQRSCVAAIALILSFCASARTIGGIVVYENGDPLPGATVKEVPANPSSSVAMVITDVQGHFSLTIANNDSEIECYFIGFQPRKIKLTDKNSYRIQLEPSVANLDEVVVTGYQTLSRERTTGSFAKVDKSQLETQRITSVGDMLEGHVAGYTDGKIRGITSMQCVTTPLYVVDGFPIERTTVGYSGGGFEDQIPDINIDDVESITVLKDAAATSIYGARAANGVIVITTKNQHRQHAQTPCFIRYRRQYRQRHLAIHDGLLFNQHKARNRWYFRIYKLPTKSEPPLGKDNYRQRGVRLRNFQQPSQRLRRHIQ